MYVRVCVVGDVIYLFSFCRLLFTSAAADAFVSAAVVCVVFSTVAATFCAPTAAADEDVTMAATAAAVDGEAVLAAAVLATAVAVAAVVVATEPAVPTGPLLVISSSLNATTTLRLLDTIPPLLDVDPGLRRFPLWKRTKRKGGEKKLKGTTNNAQNPLRRHPPSPLPPSPKHHIIRVKCAHPPLLFPPAAVDYLRFTSGGQAHPIHRHHCCRVLLL